MPAVQSLRVEFRTYRMQDFWFRVQGSELERKQEGDEKEKEEEEEEQE